MSIPVTRDGAVLDLDVSVPVGKDARATVICNGASLKIGMAVTPNSNSDTGVTCAGDPIEFGDSL